MLQLFSMILIGLCFGVTYHVGQRLGLEAGVASVLQNLYDALFYTFASFCQQGNASYGKTIIAPRICPNEMRAIFVLQVSIPSKILIVDSRMFVLGVCCLLLQDEV